MSSRKKRTDRNDQPRVDDAAEAVNDAVEDGQAGLPEEETSVGTEDELLTGPDEIEDAEVVDEAAPVETVSDDPSEGAADDADADTVAADAASDALADADGSYDPEADTDSQPELEPEPEPEPEPEIAKAPEPTPPPVAEAPKRSGGFLPAALGGLVAAGIGFGAAKISDTGGPSLDDGPNPAEQALSALSAQDDRLAALEARLGEIADAVAAPPDSSAVEARLATMASQLETSFGDKLDSNIAAVSTTLGGLSSGVTDLSSGIESLTSRIDSVDGALSQVDTRLTGVGSQLTSVDDRLTVVEKRPLVESSETAKAAFAAYERELDGLRASLSDQQTTNKEMSDALAAAAAAAQDQMTAIEAQTKDQMKAIEEQAQATAEAAKAEMADVEAQAKATAEAAKADKAEAEAKAQSAAARTALADLETALEAGAPFAGPLSVLAQSAEIPDVLSQSADSGIATLDALKSEFPEAARGALDASIKASVEEDSVGKLVAFLRTQTGARSLGVREGDDPDAVLSRAEAALKQAQFDAVLEELSSLPDAGQAAMAGWIDQAKARLAAVTAARELSTTIQAE